MYYSQIFYPPRPFIYIVYFSNYFLSLITNILSFNCFFHSFSLLFFSYKKFRYICFLPYYKVFQRHLFVYFFVYYVYFYRLFFIYFSHLT